MAIKSISEDRKNALNSSWIKRLFPNPQPLTSMPVIPSHLIGAKIPQLPFPTPTLEEAFGSSSCQPIAAFGSFRVPNVRESKLVDVSSSRMECVQQQDGRVWKGSAHCEGTEDFPAARRNLYKPRACNVNTTHLYERRTLSSESENLFSYWDMGRLERKNFVTSVCPVPSPASIPSRKRTANTYGFISSKFGRFCSKVPMTENKDQSLE